MHTFWAWVKRVSYFWHIFKKPCRSGWVSTKFLMRYQCCFLWHSIKVLGTWMPHIYHSGSFGHKNAAVNTLCCWRVQFLGPHRPKVYKLSPGTQDFLNVFWGYSPHGHFLAKFYEESVTFLCVRIQSAWIAICNGFVSGLDISNFLRYFQFS